jgi:hypothetical protein
MIAVKWAGLGLGVLFFAGQVNAQDLAYDVIQAWYAGDSQLQALTWAIPAQKPNIVYRIIGWQSSRKTGDSGVMYAVPIFAPVDDHVQNKERSNLLRKGMIQGETAEETGKILRARVQDQVERQNSGQILQVMAVADRYVIPLNNRVIEKRDGFRADDAALREQTLASIRRVMASKLGQTPAGPGPRGESRVKGPAPVPASGSAESVEPALFPGLPPSP